jgi:hypothetical protein
MKFHRVSDHFHPYGVTLAAAHAGQHGEIAARCQFGVRAALPRWNSIAELNEGTLAPLVMTT